MSTGFSKEEFLSQLTWREPRKSGRGNEDVSIVLCKDNRLNFTFRNDALKRMGNPEYLTVCFHKNRVLFKAADASSGYKLGSNRSVNEYLQIPILGVSEKVFIGDYDLKFDDFLELFYVEKVSKISK